MTVQEEFTMTELSTLLTPRAELDPDETTWYGRTIWELFFETHDVTLEVLADTKGEGYTQSVFLGYVPMKNNSFFIVGYDTNGGGAYIKVYLGPDGSILRTIVKTSSKSFYEKFRDQLDVKFPQMISLRED